jgi:uncharacterized protein (DUF2147 family)
MKYLLLVVVLFLTTTALGQTITGEWETYDDETNENKALIEIYQTGDRYFAKIVKSYISDNTAICKNCPGAKKDTPIAGLVIIEDLKKDGDEYNDGEILDPQNGKTYSCYVELVDDNKLKVRGFLGVSLFGRTQYWRRKQL